MSEQELQPKPIATNLSPQEAQVLDSLLESMAAQARAQAYGGCVEVTATDPAAPGDAQTVERVASLLHLIGQCPAGEPSLDLTQKTLERVADARRQRWFAEQAQALAAPRGGMGWNEVGALAAILLIGASLLWPIVGRVRSDARKLACAGNLQTAGLAMGRYASDNSDRLPRRGSWPGQVWWNVGKASRQGEPIQSNSAHLYALVRGGYISAESLNCPDNRSAPKFMSPTMQDWPNAAAVSYSYQNQYSPQPVRIDRSLKLAILADKNPLFAGQGGREGLQYRAELSPQTPSQFHLGLRGGQNILMVHGGVVWTNQPVLPNGDNIWLANGVDHYNGTEAPADPSDSFLVP